MKKDNIITDVGCVRPVRDKAHWVAVG